MLSDLTDEDIAVLEAELSYHVKASEGLLAQLRRWEHAGWQDLWGLTSCMYRYHTDAARRV